MQNQSGYILSHNGPNNCDFSREDSFKLNLIVTFLKKVHCNLQNQKWNTLGVNNFDKFASTSQKKKNPTLQGSHLIVATILRPASYLFSEKFSRQLELRFEF